MRTLLYKMTQHPAAMEALVKTGSHRLVHTRNDAVWGVGRDGKTGENRMGNALMRLRDGVKSKRIPRDGLCAACRRDTVLVSSVSATVMSYCSPGCRAKLGLAEEVHPDTVRDDELAAGTAGSGEP